MVDWFANLYDPKIGGWYYSNGARDNDTVIYKEKEYKLLPDAESTCQALGFINGSGMLEGIGGNYSNILPEWMKKQIISYVKGLQDPDGYFYHPHWGKEIPVSRRARDFSWCTGILNTLGEKPNYPTILDAKKGNATTDTLIPDHLKSPEAFAEYLISLNVPNCSYPAGNTLSSQSMQIKACGLFDQMIEYLSSIQHADTGLWHSVPDYYGVNGLMKISGLYVGAGLVLPHSLEAANSAFDAIISDVPIGTVVELWNTWEAITRIVANLRKNGGEDGERMANEIFKKMRERAPEAIRRSKEKIEAFKKADGGFSYGTNWSSQTSQGMPVTLYHAPEGDINATVIAGPYLISSIFSVLNLAPYKIPLYDATDRVRFLEILEKNRNA